MTDIEKPDVIGATRRAETIRQGMISYAAALEAIGEAYENRDWVALGHKDWDTYCEKEFSERRLKLTREQREQAVLAFRGAGMSIRAIGSALGVSVNTVQKDLSQSDTPAEITGADGKTYAASRPAHTETSGLVGTSPVDESGEDHPAPPLGDAADVAGARDLGDETGEQEEPPVASLPVDEPEPSGAGVSRSAPAPLVPTWLAFVSAVNASVYDLCDLDAPSVADVIDDDLFGDLGLAVSKLGIWYSAALKRREQPQA